MPPVTARLVTDTPRNNRESTPPPQRWQRMERLGRGVLISFLMLFAALYAGFGVQSPYLPALLKDHGLAAEAIGVVLASGTAIRLAAGPLAGRLADRFDATRLVFAAFARAAGRGAGGYAAG